MKITEVKINLTTNQEPVKAFVSITIDDCFRINDLRIIKKTENNTIKMFVAMPSKKTKNPNKLHQVFKDIAHPINSETRQYVEETVLQEYEKALQSFEKN